MRLNLFRASDFEIQILNLNGEVFMCRNKAVIYVLIPLLCIFFTGCAALQRKFVRKKKKEEKIAPIVTTYDYSKDLRVDELYKKHFLFWKTWQAELIDKMDGSYKKRSECYNQIVANLSEMKRYLTGPKAVELEDFLIQIKSIEPNIKKKRLSKSEKYRMRHLLEMTRRQIEKRFSHSDVKDFLELRK